MLAAVSSASPAPQRTAIKHPNSAYLIVAFTAMCVTAMIAIHWLAVLYLIPLLGIVYIARTATIVDGRGITARAIFGAQHVAWDDLTGLRITDRGEVYAMDRRGILLRLPCVRGTRLKRLVAASGGRIPDPSVNTVAPEQW
jgi:hypothetical protein